MSTAVCSRRSAADSSRTACASGFSTTVRAWVAFSRSAGGGGGDGSLVGQVGADSRRGGGAAWGSTTAAVGHAIRLGPRSKWPQERDGWARTRVAHMSHGAAPGAHARRESQRGGAHARTDSQRCEAAAARRVCVCGASLPAQCAARSDSQRCEAAAAASVRVRRRRCRECASLLARAASQGPPTRAPRQRLLTPELHQWHCRRVRDVVVAGQVLERRAQLLVR